MSHTSERCSSKICCFFSLFSISMVKRCYNNLWIWFLLNFPSNSYSNWTIKIIVNVFMPFYQCQMESNEKCFSGDKENFIWNVLRIFKGWLLFIHPKNMHHSHIMNVWIANSSTANQNKRNKMKKNIAEFKHIWDIKFYH